MQAQFLMCFLTVQIHLMQVPKGTRVLSYYPEVKATIYCPSDPLYAVALQLCSLLCW